MNNCENCHHFNELIHWDEGIFYQCMNGCKLWERCNKCDPIDESNNRYMVDDAGTLIDIQTRDTYDIFEEFIDVLNNLVRENEILEKRIEAFELSDNIADLECEVAKLITKQKNILTVIQELEENIRFDKKQGIEKYPSYMVIDILNKIKEELK